MIAIRFNVVKKRATLFRSLLFNCLLVLLISTNTWRKMAGLLRLASESGYRGWFQLAWALSCSGVTNPFSTLCRWVIFSILYAFLLLNRGLCHLPSTACVELIKLDLFTVDFSTSALINITLQIIVLQFCSSCLRITRKS